jgi:hypothetical protein
MLILTATGQLTTNTLEIIMFAPALWERLYVSTPE